MNDLSWMLYWAEVAGTVRSLLFAATTISGIGYAFFLIHGNFRWFVCDDDSDGIMPRLAKTWSKVPLLFALPLIASFVPSQNTIYAIAASEMGEQALETPVATKAGKALEKWLDNQISDKATAK